MFGADRMMADNRLSANSWVEHNKHAKSNSEATVLQDIRDVMAKLKDAGILTD